MKSLLFPLSITMFSMISLGAHASISADAYMDKMIMCSKHEKAAIRLFCYEDISEKIIESKKDEAPAKDIGEWLRKDYVGSDDQQVFTASINATKEKYASYQTPPRLEISCSGETLDVYVHWGQYLSNESPMLTHLDDDTPDRQKWIRSKDSHSSIYPDDTSDFVSDMLDSDTFTAKITPYNSSTVTAVFNLEYMNDAISKIKDHCDI